MAVRISLIALAALMALALLSCIAHDESGKDRYICPMHPQVKSDKKGSCPICGMDLVPVTPGMEATSQGENSGKAAVHLTREKEELLGVTYGKVERRDLDRVIRTSARAVVDETRQYSVSTRFSGWVEKLYADYKGMKIRKGMPLFRIYSEELYSAGGELVSAIKYSGSVEGRGSDIVESAKRKLSLLGLSDQQIAGIEASGKVEKSITFKSEYSGFIAEKNVSQGDRVESGAVLFRIADISRIWVFLDIYESDRSLVGEGTPVELELGAYPGRTFEGKVTFISPELNPETRTFSVRAEFDNKNGEILPEMYGEATVSVERKDILTVPESAVIFTGKRSYVFVKTAVGVLEPVETVTGEKGRGFYEVIGGLSGGETVAVSANFLLDSEASLKALIENGGE